MNILPFTHAVTDAHTKRTLEKSSHFTNKMIMVNGFNGSGKTLFSPLVSSIQGVELMAFAYEIEWCSSFLYSNQLDPKAYDEFVRLYVDHLTYNQMMARSVNFRWRDLSSAFNYKPWWTYVLRLFSEGDNAVTSIVHQRKPILSLTTCHLMPVFPSLARALKSRLLFIEVVRDPMFMFQQLLVLHKTVIAPRLEKDFTIRAVENNAHATYLDFYSDSSVFEGATKQSDEAKVVSYLERMCDFYFKLDLNMLKTLEAKFMLIPFERFVLKPNEFLEEIVRFTGAPWTKSINKEMERQRVPRKLLRAGRKLAVYRRFGWDDSDVNASMTLADENQAYRLKISTLIGDQTTYKRLELISDKYHEWLASF